MKYIYLFLISFFSALLGKQSMCIADVQAEIIQKNDLERMIVYSDNHLESRDSNSKKIDELLRKADDNMNLDFLKTLDYAQKANILAERTGDDYRKIVSSYYLCRGYSFFEKHKEALDCIEKCLNQDIVKNNKTLEALFRQLKSSCYSRLYLFPLASKEYSVIESLLSSVNTPVSRIILAQNYLYRGDYYTDMKDFDKAHHYLDKSIVLYQEMEPSRYLKLNRAYRNFAYVYYCKAIVYLRQNDTKSAFSYLKKGYDQAILDQLKYISIFFEAYGDYYTQIKDYKTAITYYVKAIDNKKEFGRSFAEIQIKVAKLYALLGDHKLEQLYLEKSSERRVFDEYNSRVNVQEALKDVLNEHETEKNKIERDRIYGVIAAIAIAFSIIVFIYKFQQRHSQKLLQDKTAKLDDNKNKIRENEEVIKHLKNQVNVSFSEVIALAKENSPEFLARFKEVYPQIYQKLLFVNPKIKSSELIFFGYLYLGFSTKDIATYTFVTVHAVEVRKSRLRKKYHISSELDFKSWLETIRVE